MRLSHEAIISCAGSTLPLVAADLLWLCKHLLADMAVPRDGNHAEPAHACTPAAPATCISQHMPRAALQLVHCGSYNGIDGQACKIERDMQCMPADEEAVLALLPPGPGDAVQAIIGLLTACRASSSGPVCWLTAFYK